jgi:hypothetical protein
VDPLAWLEVRDLRGRLVERVRLDALPATVGRAYSNDVVLADRFVCPRHLRIDRADDGAFVVEDVGSVNGLSVGPREEMVERATLGPGGVFRIGRSTLRLLTGETPVEPTLRDGSHAHDDWSARSVALAVAAALGLFLVGAFQGNYTRTAIVDSLRGAIVFGVLVLAWAAAWAAASRIVTHRWRLGAHLAIACGVFALSAVVEVAFGYTGFLLSAGDAMDVASWLAGAAFLAWLLDAHVSLVSGMSRRRRHACAAAVSLAVSAGLAFLLHWDDGSFTSEVDIQAALKPVPAAWVRGETLDDFLAGIDELEREVTALAARPR